MYRNSATGVFEAVIHYSLLLWWTAK